MVDDQGNTFGGLSNSGDPSDNSDPDAHHTEIALLPNSATDSASLTDSDNQGDDSTTLATPGTIDWLNPGAENDPLFNDTDSQGDGEQQTDSGMVDDLDNAASGTPVDSNSSTDSGISTDTSDPGVELSTQIALLNGSSQFAQPHRHR